MLFCNSRLIRISCFVYKSFGSLPLDYNSKNNELQLTGKFPTSVFHKKRNFCLITTAAFVVGGFMKLFAAPNKNSSYLLETSFFCFSLLLGSACLLMHHVCYKHNKIICQYITGLLHFQIQAKLQGIPRIAGKYLAERTLGYGLYLIFPLWTIGFVYALHWNGPCKASITGFWLIPECHPILGWSTINSRCYKGIGNFTVKIVVLLINQWSWSFAMSTTGFSAIVLLMMSTITLKECLKM